MKTKYITLIIALLTFGNIYSQNTVSDLHNFVKNADMDCYLAKIQKNVLDCHKAQCEYFKVPDTTNPPKVEFLKGKTVPMLVVQFVNMDNYDLGKDIYDHITIDSTRVFTLACVDNNMNVLAFANYYDGTYAYTEVNAERPEDVEKLEQVINNINSQGPETILFCHSLKNFHDLNSFMFIKAGKIYVYRVIEADVFELNDYIRQFFQEEKIRSLSNTNVPFMYQHYDKVKPIRKTGDTPEKYKMLCK
ncbi:MAG: hypothetical protein LBL79_04945 [Prevotella sp.]|jgi:hypothetical protein|nr:hypothetical protein [Prevotella sp.]